MTLPHRLRSVWTSIPQLLLATVLLLGGGLSISAEEESLPVLRRKLLEASGDARIGAALDKLTEKIGEADFFTDHAAFGEWLGSIPDGRAEHLLVRQRRGWAYVRAKQGTKALPLLESAVKEDPGDGLTRAYLGEALRQAKRYLEAAKMLAAALRCGHYGKHVHESLVQAVILSQRASISGHADDLPEYVLAAQAYLAVRAEASIHHMVASMLLKDIATFEKPDRERGRHWIRVAAKHALASVRLADIPLAGSEKLVYDAAVALSREDRKTEGATLRFDLLSWAYRLGRDVNGGGHKRPQILTWLAEAAEGEGRYELAHRLAQERLEISNSPRARRLLMRLPPDLGDRDD